MNIKQMEAALTKASPKSKASVNESTPFHLTVAETLGAIPSNAKGFFAAIGTSYKYNEAVRKGLI